MGFYIDSPIVDGKMQHLRGKTDWLIKEHGAQETSVVTWPPPPGTVYVCVVDNFHWDAAAIAYSEEEFWRFLEETGNRPVRWLLMNRSEVVQLNKAVRQVLWK